LGPKKTDEGGAIHTLTAPAGIRQNSAEIGLPVFFVDANGLIVARNTKAGGLKITSQFSELFEDSDHIDLLIETSFDGGGVERPYRLLSGREVLLSVERSVQDDVEVFIVVLFDVTHYHMLSEESQLSRRLTAVGNLAAGVAYEISNPLTVLLGRLEFLSVIDSPSPQMVNRHLKIMRSHAARISSTVKNLQVFAHPALGVRESVSVSTMLQSAVLAAQSRIGKVQIALVVEPSDLSTTGDPALLEQVFTALFITVAEGSGRLGRIVVKSSIEDGNCQILVGTDSHLANDVEWAPMEQAAQGLGFGVTLAAAIVREHGGVLQCRQEERQLSFLMKIPMVRAPIENQRQFERWKVLFVDDDEELCLLGSDMVSASGHECVTAVSAEEALAILEKESFDLIVADVGLPGLSGLAFREIVRKRWVDLRDRVVLVTGLSMRAPDGVRLLQKPFTHCQLLKVLEQAKTDC
jgi:signal transduction histidine kinase/CheY-like chemotaxis protein